MNQSLRENKQSIRSFMQNHYTDSRLAELLCHARDGKLRYYSCCCFIGIATADHALRPMQSALSPPAMPHYREAKRLVAAPRAERAFFDISGSGDLKRRSLIIPMVRAEIRRRDLLKAKAHAETEVESLQNV